MATLEVRDERPEMSPRIVAKHHNIRDISPKELICYYGIAKHLRVIVIEDDKSRRVVQDGRR